MKKSRFVLGLFLLGIAPIWAQNHIVEIADPTITCFEGTYYLYGTEKSPQQGIPALASTDLQTWHPVGCMEGYALKKGGDTYGDKGFWAPQVLYRNGRYYMVYTANEHIAIAESNAPQGPFVQKNVQSIDADTRQIDPYLFVDTDGKMYLYHVRLFKGNTIWVAEFKEDMGGIKEETLKQCVTATEHWEDTQSYPSAPVIEGPTVIKRGKYYYLFYSANHFMSPDYAVGYAYSESPYGPWRKAGNNPIINKYDVGINGPGHGDLFVDKDNNYKYVFHSHADNTKVNNRRTWTVDVLFSTCDGNGPEIITIDSHSLVPLYLSDEKQ